MDNMGTVKFHPLVCYILSDLNGVKGRSQEPSSRETHRVKSILSFPTVRKRRFRHSFFCEKTTVLQNLIKGSDYL